MRKALRHVAVAAADAEIPLLQFPHQIVERVPVLGKNQQPLVEIVKETFFLGQFLGSGKFRSCPGVFYSLGMDCQLARWGTEMEWRE